MAKDIGLLDIHVNVSVDADFGVRRLDAALTCPGLTGQNLHDHGLVARSVRQSTVSGSVLDVSSHVE
jgi:hypothetical protein